MNGMEQHGGSQWYIGTPNGIVLCIEQRRGSELAGRFYHRYSAEPIAFSDLGQMTLLMEKLYDDLQFPFAGTNERRFSDSATAPRMRQEKEERMSDDQLLQKHGDIGTFIVRVQHRQNSSWQGRITWMEEDKTICFRSVWEMIKLIESAMDTVSTSEDGEEPTWEN